MKYFVLVVFFLFVFIFIKSFVGIYDSLDMNLFFKLEYNSIDLIILVGIEFMVKNNYSNFGVVFIMVLGLVEVFIKKGDWEIFFILDSGIKFGYFSDFFVYGEVGLDLIEFVFYDDWKDYDYSDCYDDDYNNIDGYVGVGMGVDLKLFRIEIYVRVWEIDSCYWEV